MDDLRSLDPRGSLSSGIIGKRGTGVCLRINSTSYSPEYSMCTSSLAKKDLASLFFAADQA